MKVRRTPAAVSTLLTLMLIAGVTLSSLCGKGIPSCFLSEEHKEDR